MNAKHIKINKCKYKCKIQYFVLQIHLKSGLREAEMAILRRTEGAMVRSMCGVKSEDRKKMEDLREMLGLKETLDRMAKANGVRW